MSSIARHALLAALVFGPLAAAADTAKPAGSVVVAKAAGAALLIWDASADVTGIVSNKTADSDANALLERDAARVLAASLAKFDKKTSSLSVRIIYQKTGAVSPEYGTATFAGVERYATLTLDSKNAKANRDKWRTLGDSGTIPSWFAFNITGQLPPR